MATTQRSKGTKSKAAGRKKTSQAAAPPAGLKAAKSREEVLATLTGVDSEKIYYRIGEVAELTGIKPYVLRYWESEFRWMAPQKSRSKQRLYRKKDIEMVLLIKKLLYEERYTIAGARRWLREQGVDKALATLAADPPGVDHRHEYKRIREELVAIRASL